MHGAADLACIIQLKGFINALGAPLDGVARGYLGGGLPARGPYGVENEAGVNPMMCDCSQIGASGDHSSMWWGTLNGVASVRGPSAW